MTSLPLMLVLRAALAAAALSVTGCTDVIGPMIQHQETLEHEGDPNYVICPIELPSSNGPSLITRQQCLQAEYGAGQAEQQHEAAVVPTQQVATTAEASPPNPAGSPSRGSETVIQNQYPNALLPTNMTELEKQAVATCHYSTEQDIEDCYEDALKSYTNHPQDLMSGDVRDAVAYCAHDAASYDAQFCNNLQQQYQALFDEEAQDRVASAARDSQRAAAAQANEPKIVAVIAHGISVVPGAIVCPDLDTVTLMFDAYTNAWSDAMRDKISNGQYGLINGQAGTMPDFSAYGCALVPNGAPMTMERGNIVPVVSAILSDGTRIRGVTLPNMVSPR